MTDLSALPIPMGVVYAGLVGAALSLLVATWQNNWSLRVFFLLALRLAIGWHFLFEGLTKVNKEYVGVTETSKPFSSEAYFNEAEGPAAPLLKKSLGGDPDVLLLARLTPKDAPARPPQTGREEFVKHLAERPDSEFLKHTPDEFAKEWDAYVAAFAAQYKQDPAALKPLADEQKAQYARWVLGVPNPYDKAGRFSFLGPKDAKKRFFPNDVPLTIPDRVADFQKRKEYLAELNARRGEMGRTNEMSRVTAAKGDVRTLRGELQKEYDDALAAFKADLFRQTLGRPLAAAGGPRSELLSSNPKEPGIDPAKLDAVLPPAAGFDPGKSPTFADLPAPVQKAWDRYVEAVKTTYPLSDEQKKDVDAAAASARQRLANWYYDRNELSGAPAPEFGVLVDAYRNAVKAVAQPAPSPAGTFLERVAAQAARQRQEAAVPPAQAAVVAALEDQFADLKKLTAGAIPSDTAAGLAKVDVPKKRVWYMDWATRWGLTLAGALLLVGLFTRLACIGAGGFLLITYVVVPPLPWLPTPPNQEGFYLFVNKNLVEMFALFALATFPTGRWLGLDAWICGVLGCGRGKDAPTAP